MVDNEIGLGEDRVELPLRSEALALQGIPRLSLLQHIVEEEDEG